MGLARGIVVRGAVRVGDEIAVTAVRSSSCESGSQRVSAVPPPFTTVGASEGAAGPTATLRSDSVTGSPRAAASAARPRSPADG